MNPLKNNPPKIEQPETPPQKKQSIQTIYPIKGTAPSKAASTPINFQQERVVRTVSRSSTFSRDRNFTKSDHTQDKKYQINTQKSNQDLTITSQASAYLETNNNNNNNCMKNRSLPPPSYSPQVKKPDDRNTFAFKTLASLKTRQEVESAIKQLKNQNFSLTLKTYTMFLTWLSENQGVQAAFEAFNQMESLFSLSPDRITYNAMIKICSTNGNLTLGLSIYERMLFNGVCPELSTYNQLLHLYGLGGQAQSGIKFYEQLIEDRFFTPDICTYNTVMKLHGLAGNAQEGILFFHENIENAQIKPSTVTFNTLFDLYELTEDYLKGIKLYDSIRNQVDFDIRTYNKLFKLYGLAGHPQAGIDLFWELKENYEIYPSTFSYNILLDLYGLAGEPQTGINLYLRLVNNRALLPDNTTYNTLLKLYGLAAQPQAGINFYRQLIAENRFQPDTITYNTLFNLYGLAGQPRTGIHFYEQLRAANCLQPDCVTFNTLLNLHALAEQPEVGIALYGQLKDDKVFKPNAVTYTTMLNLYKLANQAQEGIDFYLKNQGAFKPTPVTHNSLIDLYVLADDIDSATKAFNQCGFKIQMEGEMLNCHNYSIGPACIMVDMCLKNNQNKQDLLVITGIGLHAKNHELFKMRDGLQEFLKKYHPYTMCQLADNLGMIQIIYK